MKHLLCALLLVLPLCASTLKEHIKESYQNAIPTININSITLKKQSNSRFDNGTIINIKIPKHSLLRDHGSIAVIYQMPNSRERRAYYRYSIDATIDVIKAKHHIAKGEIIDHSNTVHTPTPYTKFHSPPINFMDLGSYQAKLALKAGTVISQRDLKKIELIQVGDRLNATVSEVGLELETTVTARAKGSLGEIINVQTPSGKIIKAKVLSRNSVKVLE
jgi:flagella basal body P-ring formation protein FlgA